MIETRAQEFTCPQHARGPDDVIGCGHVFTAEPDHEGLVDCPECGMWFEVDAADGKVVES